MLDHIVLLMLPIRTSGEYLLNRCLPSYSHSANGLELGVLGLELNAGSRTYT